MTLDYTQLKQLLTSSGCLKESDNRGYYIDGRKNWDGTPLVKQDVCWITDPAKLEEVLKTEKEVKEKTNTKLIVDSVKNIIQDSN